MDRLRVSYRFEILFLFVLLEVLLFDASSDLQTIVAILEYAFLFFVFLKDFSIGILYFLSFALLTIGWGNYFDTDVPNNFWGIRIGGFSLNILFSLSLCFFCLIRYKWKFFLNNSVYLFMFSFILYSIVVGVLNLLLGINYADNFFNDLMTYLPFCIYVVLLSDVDRFALLRLLKYVVFLSVLTLILSFLFNKRTVYSESYFLLSNAVSLVLPVLVILSKQLYSKTQWLLMVLVVYFFIVLGEYFISGKVIILYFLFFFWICWFNNKLKIIFLFPFVFLLTNVEFLLECFADFFSGNVISYKFSQISDVISTVDLYTLAALPSSMGNLIAEGLTVFHYQTDHWYYLLFGGGFGSGVPDVFGYLAPWAGTSGYAAIDLSRDNFYKMHLPIYEIMLKGGLAFLIPYALIVVGALLNRNVYLFVFGLLFFLGFYVTKEMFLLTLIMLKLSCDTSKYRKKFNINC